MIEIFGRLPKVRLIGAAALSLLLTACSITEAITFADAARNTQIAARIADQQSSEIRGFLREYVNVNYIDPGDILVTPQPVSMEEYGNTAFSQDSTISGTNSDNHLGVFRSSYDKNGVLRFRELRVNRAAVNLPAINSAIDATIIVGGSNDPRLANLYEELLRKALTLPAGVTCQPSTNRIMGQDGTSRDALSVSCIVQNVDQSVLAFVEPGGEKMGFYSNDPKLVSCGT